MNCTGISCRTLNYIWKCRTEKTVITSSLKCDPLSFNITSFELFLKRCFQQVKILREDKCPISLCLCSHILLQWTWMFIICCLFHSCLLWFLFMSGGDRDESEDTAGDLRRTESDSVLKKVGISAANYSWLWNPLRPHASMRTWGHVWGCICPPTFTTLLRWI